MTLRFSRIEKFRLLLLRHTAVLVLIAMGSAPNVQAETQKERLARLVIYNYISQEADPIDQMVRDR